MKFTQKQITEILLDISNKKERFNLIIKSIYAIFTKDFLGR
jgi:hypothetical protein